jgi:hypothetical protein
MARFARPWTYGLRPHRMDNQAYGLPSGAVDKRWTTGMDKRLRRPADRFATCPPADHRLTTALPTLPTAAHAYHHLGVFTFLTNALRPTLRGLYKRGAL